MTYCTATGKVSYASEWEARNARNQIAQRLRQKHSSKRRLFEGKPYRCQCGYWHLTSKVPA
jgi:hypothetical protein